MPDVPPNIETRCSGCPLISDGDSVNHNLGGLWASMLLVGSIAVETSTPAYAVRRRTAVCPWAVHSRRSKWNLALVDVLVDTGNGPEPGL